MSKFYDVVYVFCGQLCKTTILADGEDQIRRILSEHILGDLKIKSYEESK